MLTIWEIHQQKCGCKPIKDDKNCWFKAMPTLAGCKPNHCIGKNRVDRTYHRQTFYWRNICYTSYNVHLTQQ